LVKADTVTAMRRGAAPETNAVRTFALVSQAFG
jgi:hypothetical protein